MHIHVANSVREYESSEDAVTPAGGWLFLSGLSPDLRGRVLQVFISLTQPSLLERCLQNQTQNKNESLHSKLWRKCLKVKFAYLHRTIFAANVTSLHHNLGEVRGHVLVALGLVPSHAISTKKRKEEAPLKAPLAKRKRVSASQPSTSYTPGGIDCPTSVCNFH